jgi:plastocyanin
MRSRMMLMSMRIKSVRRVGSILPLAAFAFFFLQHTTAGAATASVTVGDIFFAPASVTINVQDSVRWVWTGFAPHSTTSVGLWDSGIHTNGFAFTNTFASAGTFPYRCTVHALVQSGTVIVQSGSQPPAVSIASPANGSTFAAPWSGSVQGAVAASGATVTNLSLFADGTLLATVPNPPASYSVPVSGLGAGNYVLTAVGMDDNGLTNNATVQISVLTPAPIVLSSAQQVSASSFQFNYSATPGLSYVVRRSPDLITWTPVRTNTAASGSVLFQDLEASGALNFYSVQLMPNP